MSVDRAEIQKLAQLARIAISEDNINATTKSIGEVLNLINQLSSIDTSSTKPLAHPLDTSQRLREDRATEPNVREQLQAIAPAVEDGLYLVPRVIE